MRELNEQVALVTGGGGGLGEAICRILGEAGVTVAAADVRPDRAEAVARAVNAAGGRAVAARLDVRDAAEAAEVIREIAASFGRLDILVNNAGVDVTLAVDELPLDDWDRIIAVNLRGPFVLAKAVFPLMKRQGGGQIVNIVSTAAKRAWPNATAYHASKWGLLGLSHALHAEGRAHNIKVTAVVSGGMRTPFLLERFPDLDPGLLQDPRNVAEAVRFALGQPAETVVPEIMVLPMRETSWP